MPSSKRVTGNFNFWTGNTGNWTYPEGNTMVTIKRGTSDTRYYSSNLLVYGNIVSQGGDIYANAIYANIRGNFVISGQDYGVLYKAPNSAAGVSDQFTLNNNFANMLGNIVVTGTGASNGRVESANLVINQTATIATAVITTANVTAVNIGANTANITANGRITGTSFVYTGNGQQAGYSDSRVFNYLDSTGAKLINISGSAGTPGEIQGNGTISVTGNITTDNYFIGNGAFLTGLPASYSNANVAAYLPTYTGSLPNLTGNVTTTANISGGYFLGNGALLSGLGATYSNANVAAYLPTYNGNILLGNATVTGTANIVGNAIFGNVNNLRIPGGTQNQYLQTDGNGNVTFANVEVTPGNAPSSIQYNYQGNSLRGIDNFTYNLDTISNLQVSNISLIVSRGQSTVQSDQLIVAGNANITTAQVDGVESGGYLSIGGIDRLQPNDLTLANFDGQVVVVLGNSLDYGVAARNVWSNANSYIAVSGANTADVKFSLGANFIQLISSGNTSNITVGSNTANVTIDFARPVISSIVTGNASQIVIGGNAIQPNISIATSSVTASSYGNASIVSTFTVGSDGRLTMAANTPISITASQISDLSASLSGSANAAPATVKTLSLTIGGTTYNLLAWPT